MKTKKGKTYEEMYGKKKAEEIKAKLSRVNKGKKLSIETIRKMTGREITKETKAKLRKASLKRRLKFGYINSPETRRKLSEINKGKKHSKETIEKLKQIHSNRSKETRRRMGIAHKGKKQSKETILKRIMTRKGYKHSEETKKKISEAHFNLPEEIKARNKGKKNPNWKGGKSFEPYTSDFNIRFKEKIRERDGYTCKLCNLFEEDHLKLYRSKLYIHHIDYDKLNTFPQNCISLCIRCHTITNQNREIWTRHFQELLKKLYDYEYTQDQKIILDFTKKW